MAHMEIDKEGRLNFKWDDGLDSQNTDLANLLRNCPLRITTTTGRAEAVIYLRMPIVDKPLGLDALKERTTFTTEGHNLRDVPKDIPAELEILPVLPPGLKTPTADDETKQVWSFCADKGVAFRLTLNVEHRKGGMHVGIVLADLGVAIDKNKVFAHSIAKYITSQQGEKSKKDEQRKAPHAKPSETEELSHEIEELDTFIERAQQIQKVYGSVIDSGVLRYRVYLPIDKYKVELISSEQRKPVPNLPPTNAQGP